MNNSRVAFRSSWVDLRAILILISFAISECAASTVPACDISPSQRLIITEGEPSTLTCTASCQDLRNEFFIRPDPRENINIIEAPMFDHIHGDVNRTTSTNHTTCSIYMDLYWTQDEQIRSELNSVKCVFVYNERPKCETDPVSILFSDLKCNITKIAPSDLLLIPKGESSTLSCTAPCTNGSGIHIMYFIRPGNGQDKENLRILDDPAIRQYLSIVNFTSTNESCRYSVDISWTEDKVIRRELDSLYCVFIYDGTYSESCRTVIVPVKFTDTMPGSSTSESLHIPHTQPSMNYSNGDVIMSRTVITNLIFIVFTDFVFF